MRATEIWLGTQPAVNREKPVFHPPLPHNPPAKTNPVQHDKGETATNRYTWSLLDHEQVQGKTTERIALIRAIWLVEVASYSAGRKAGMCVYSRQETAPVGGRSFQRAQRAGRCASRRQCHLIGWCFFRLFI